MNLAQPVVAILPVFNEESRIKNTLVYYSSSLTCPLYIVDSYSSDQTVSICSDFAELFPLGLSVLYRKNNGTTETQEWIDWLLHELSYEFFIFLSCSEVLSPQCLDLYASSVDLGYDLVYVHRRSFFLGGDISQVYSRPKDIVRGKKSYFPLCRFASRRALSSIPTFIHDNWLSSARFVNTLFSHDETCFACHYKNSDLTANLIKHISYAKNDAEKNSDLRKSFIRIIREILYIVFFAITFRLKPHLLIDLLMRVGYHINVITFLVFNSSLESNSAEPNRSIL